LQHTQFERLAVTLLDDDGQHWRLVLASSGRFQVGKHEPVTGTRSGWVITHKQPMVVDDLATQVSPHFILNAQLLQSGIRSSIHVPLSFGEQVFGTLNVPAAFPGCQPRPA
jgi:GAF domain-containing protein